MVAMVTFLRNNTLRIFFFFNVNLQHTQVLIIHSGSRPGTHSAFFLSSIIESLPKDSVENCILFSPDGNFVKSKMVGGTLGRQR